MTTRDVFSFLEIETPNLPETPVAKRVVEPVEEQHVCKTPKALDQVSKLVDDDQDEPEEECKVKAPLIKKSPSRILKKVVSRTQEATAFAEPAKRLLRPRAQSKAAADLKRDILALKKRKAAGTVQVNLI